jgi:predicted transcriptional regulator
MIQELDQRLREANDQIRAMKEKEEAVQAERNDLEQLLRNEQQTSTGLKVMIALTKLDELKPSCLVRRTPLTVYIILLITL